MMTKKESIKIVNIMTPRAGFLVPGMALYIKSYE